LTGKLCWSDAEHVSVLSVSIVLWSIASLWGVLAQL
jgi:hypothetical protein